MLKALLVLCPFVAVVVVGCGDDAQVGGNTNGGSSGSGGSQAGKSSTGASNSSGGSDSGKAGAANGDGGVDNRGGAPIGSAGTDSSGAGDGSGGSGVGEAGSSNAGGNGAGGGGNDGLCPDVFGAYQIQSSVGTCGTLNDAAVQSIEGTDQACFAHFVSVLPADSPGVNGGATLDANGDFAGAMLFLGTSNQARNPCSGSWDAQKSTMTVACGGDGDLCTVVMKQK